MIWLHNARILSIFAVVLLHCASLAQAGAKIGSETWWVANVYDSMTRWCVPVFVMMSGALLLDPKKNETLRTFYKKRVSKILIPLLFWTIFYLIWGFQTKEIKGDLVRLTLQGKAFYHLWFLYMISMLYLFTPFLRKIVVHSSDREISFFTAVGFIIAASSAVYVAVYRIEFKLFLMTFLAYIPYFFLGLFIRNDQRNVSSIVWILLFLGSVGATGAGCYFWSDLKNAAAGAYFYQYLSITVIPMSISILYLLKKWNRPIISETVTKKLSSLTMGIYLIHPFFIVMIKKIGLSYSSFDSLFSIPTVALLVFFISLLATWIGVKLPIVRRIF